MTNTPYEYTATYCPEDDKLRLYTGYVERELYLRLKKEGWVSTPKQECDFVAYWKVRREDTALELCGYIGDEDRSLAERAADRAERFGGYRNKRMSEALSYADTFESQPTVHGYQSADKAEKAAARHARTGVKACNQWEKVEYWTARTGGVIRNALYKLKPAVRMGRIKELEKEERKAVSAIEDHNREIDLWESLNESSPIDSQARILKYLCGKCWAVYKHNGEEKRLYQLHRDGLSLEELKNYYLSDHKKIEGETRLLAHIRLRLQYERAMLKAHGGLAGESEIQVGGWLGKYQIHKVNKSHASGRVVSVDVLTDAVEGWAYKTRNIKGTDKAYTNIEVEKMEKGAYREPTPEDIEAVKAFRASLKAKAPKKPSLINPTREAAETLQKAWNKKAQRAQEESQVVEMTQAEYSARSKGDYSPCTTTYIGSDGLPTHKQYYGNTAEYAICKVRKMGSAGSLYNADRVVVITDKPQKPLPEFKREGVAA